MENLLQAPHTKVGSMASRVEYEFQYYHAADGKWATSFFGQDEQKAQTYFDAMVKRFPRDKYRVVRTTGIQEVIAQSNGTKDQ